MTSDCAPSCHIVPAMLNSSSSYVNNNRLVPFPQLNNWESRFKLAYWNNAALLSVYESPDFILVTTKHVPLGTLADNRISGKALACFSFFPSTALLMKARIHAFVNDTQLYIWFETLRLRSNQVRYISACLADISSPSNSKISIILSCSFFLLNLAPHKSLQQDMLEFPGY